MQKASTPTPGSLRRPRHPALVRQFSLPQVLSPAQPRPRPAPPRPAPPRPALHSQPARPPAAPPSEFTRTGLIKSY
ncbi:hypothetical protein E2C01_064699 [Portunus trituberculatus]|uniref:Uncharacterized protein n=1 Tax=Portunus trituberculatus TaxID=210409 RepID=A0A5B7HDR3_PORTR|nr:hypothetical protein [Portunus trituberculatus]